ncbi:MAG: glycine--tRNA ligase [Candidatus Pacearchaeota archaeon]|nr:MAG: glycine--tRNA ligase [Candidatus Pacearchaeota archaeon]
MAFIVKKKISGKIYYYLQENKRIRLNNGSTKVKTKTLAYLGKTKDEAKKRAKEFLEKNLKDKKIDIEKTEMEKKEISIEELANFCKRKGFVYISAEIYGGFSGFWDFGPFGTELKNNIKKEWWKYHVTERDDIVGIDGSIITNPKVWEASGHVASFVDIAVSCKKCGYKTKIDKSEIKNAKCEKCGNEYEIKAEFNPMFTTEVGPIKENSIKAYLRPETAQLIFINFKNIFENSRLKLPCGIAQIGKAFRNEIAPRDFLFRSREFEQMEIEYFINPLDEKCPYEIPNIDILIYSSEAQEKNLEPEKMKISEAFKQGIIKKDWHAYWLATELLWFKNLGADMNNFRIRQHKKNELSHYSTDTWDIEYKFPFGWKELEGIADRGNFDLSQHEKFSKKDLKIFDQETGKKILPNVICEPSLGVERAFLVFMFDSFYYDKKRENIVLKLHPKLSPIKAAILPIVKTNKKIVQLSKKIYNELKKNFNVFYDESGSIGRRYSRQDEIGTPFCITIDEESLKKKDVTIRDRDTTEQIRVPIENLKKILEELIFQEKNFSELGKVVNTRKKF